MLRLEEGNVLRLIYTDVDPETEEEFKRWYDAEHERMLSSVEGVLQNYKGVNLTGRRQKYFFLYVHKTASVQTSEEYRAVSQTEWSKKVRPSVKHFEVENYKAIAGGQVPRELRDGAVIRTVRFDLKADSEAQLQDWFDKLYAPFAIKTPDLIAVWRGINLQEKKPRHVIVHFLENLTGEEMLNLEIGSKSGERIREMIAEPGLVMMDYAVRRQLA